MSGGSAACRPSGVHRPDMCAGGGRRRAAGVDGCGRVWVWVWAGQDSKRVRGVSPEAASRAIVRARGPSALPYRGCHES